MSKRRKSDRATWAADRARAKELWEAWLAAPPGPEREAAGRAWLAAHGRVEALDSPGRLAEWIEAALPGLEQAERAERAAARAHGRGPPDLARLDEERDFAFLAAERLGAAAPEPTGHPLVDLARLRRLLLAAAGARPRPRRGRRAPAAKPLTTKQTATMDVVGACKNNFAEAGRRLGLNPKTVRQHYEAGLRKLGVTAKEHARMVAKPQGQPLPTDLRGQASVAGPDDGPAPPAALPRATRDRRG